MNHLPRSGWLAPAAAIAFALIMAACGSSSSSTGGSGGGATPGASASSLKTTTIHGTKVLTNAQGRTLYSFAPDTSKTSKCNGACAQIWPPMKGPATAGSGVTGKLGTIKRNDGATQASYNGHPLTPTPRTQHPDRTRATASMLTAESGMTSRRPAGRRPPHPRPEGAAAVTDGLVSRASRGAPTGSNVTVCGGNSVPR
jgi:predicted lipoprotein with Yx(FWY)xxD motif